MAEGTAHAVSLQKDKNMAQTKERTPRFGLPRHIDPDKLVPDPAGRPNHWHNEETDEVFHMGPEFEESRSDDDIDDALKAQAKTRLQTAKDQADLLLQEAQAKADAIVEAAKNHVDSVATRQEQAKKDGTRDLTQRQRDMAEARQGTADIDAHLPGGKTEKAKVKLANNKSTAAKTPIDGVAGTIASGDDLKPGRDNPDDTSHVMGLD